jgi:hypothetical protein
VGEDGRKETARKIQKYMWEDNIKMGLREVGWGGMDRIHLAKIRNQCSALLNMEVKLRAP